MPRRPKGPIIPKKDRFALWKLPDIPRKMIIQQMDPGIVIEVSLKYKAFKRFLMCYKFPCDEMAFKFMFDDPQVPRWKWFFDIENIGICLQFPQSSKFIKFMCSLPHEPLKGYRRPLKPYIARNDMCGDYYLGNGFEYEDKIFEVEQLARHFMDILAIGRIELDHICVENYEILSDCFVWKLVNKFDKVDIREGFTSDFKITKDQLKFLINETNIDELRMWIDVEDSDELPEIKMKAKKLEVKSHNWLKMKHILNSECEHIVIDNLIVELKDVLDLVISWMSGEKLQKLEKFDTNFYCISDTNLEEGVMKAVDKMEGVERITGEELKRLEKQEQGYEFYENSRKIHCVADGKIAIIGMQQDKFKFDLIKNQD